MADTNYPYVNKDHKLVYPLTKMNFRVSLSEDTAATAAFNQVTGIDSQVDVIEFRQGNADTLSPVKIPGLVKHGNVTLRYGYTRDSAFKNWIIKCVSETREASSDGYPRRTVLIELINIMEGTPATVDYNADANSKQMWKLENAWVAHYTGAELDASNSDVAMESVEIAFETMSIAN
jgi:phage tail-like protein